VQSLRALAVAILAAGVAASGALAGATPAPDRLQAQAILDSLHAKDLEIFPTRVPTHFVYDSYSVTASPPSLNVTFADSRHESNPAELGEYALSFDASYFRGKACKNGASHTLRVGGVTMYEDANLVWRCVNGTHHPIVISAHGRAAKQALATIVAYAKAGT
jgi:hypothetical protein